MPANGVTGGFSSTDVCEIAQDIFLTLIAKLKRKVKCVKHVWMTKLWTSTRATAYMITFIFKALKTFLRQ